MGREKRIFHVFTRKKAFVKMKMYYFINYNISKKFLYQFSCECSVYSRTFRWNADEAVVTNDTCLCPFEHQNAVEHFLFAYILLQHLLIALKVCRYLFFMEFFRVKVASWRWFLDKIVLQMYENQLFKSFKLQKLRKRFLYH